MDKIKKHRRLLVFLLIIVFMLILNSVFGWSELLSSPDSIPAIKNALEQNTAKAVTIYITLTIAGCVVLALPGIIFAVAAGALFGPVLGTAACSIATTIGACLAFLAGRYFLKSSVKPMVMRNKHIKRLFFEGERKNDLFLLMITRLVPVFPYNLQNFAYGITDISFGTYALYSFLFMLPGTAAYTIAAAGITDRSNRALYLVIAAAMIVTVMTVSVILRKRNLGDDGEN